MVTKNKKMIRFITASGLAFILISCIWILFTIIKGISLANEIPFSNPPDPFDESLLTGTWITSYFGGGEETIIIQPDGKFKQIYRDRDVDDGNYTFETPWKDWWIERLSDGRLHLHLEGARYFLNGPSFAENENVYFVPCPNGGSPNCKDGLFRISFLFYDWIGKEFVEMTDELILNIRVDNSGNAILVHLWESSDGGFPIIGGETELFRKETSQ